MLEIAKGRTGRYEPSALCVSAKGRSSTIEVQISTHYTTMGIELNKNDIKQIIEYLQEEFRIKEMDCKQEERIERLIERVEVLEEKADKSSDLENGKAKPIVTVHKNLLTRDYSLTDLKKELGDEYHIIPVLNQEAIKVYNGEEGQLLSYQQKKEEFKAAKEPEFQASEFPCLTIIFADDKKRIGFMDKIPYDDDEEIWTKVTYWDDKNTIKYQFELTDTIQTQRYQSGIKVTKTTLLQLKQGDRFAYTSYYPKKYKDVDNYYFAREIPSEAKTIEKVICERAHGLEFDLHYNETPIYKFTLK